MAKVALGVVAGLNMLACGIVAFGIWDALLHGWWWAAAYGFGILAVLAVAGSRVYAAMWRPPWR